MKKLIRLFVALSAVAMLLVGTSCDPHLPTTDSAHQQAEGTLEVIFLDVGQADCILLKTDGHNMLIDAGVELKNNRVTTAEINRVLGYLREYDITHLDYLVATHPHADHIGAMAAVINEMDSIGEILMPDATSTSDTFKNYLKAIEEKDVPMTIPEPGDVFMLGEARMQVLAPSSPTYSDVNDYSIVLRVEFGSKTFLLTGDAEAKSEREQLDSGLSLKADVLKVGHHGSRTSSSQAYLNAVDPIYAIISCGTGNSYGHPHNESMTRLVAMDVEIFRTDIHGTIIFKTDGNEITISVEKNST